MIHKPIPKLSVTSTEDTIRMNCSKFHKNNSLYSPNFSHSASRLSKPTARDLPVVSFLTDKFPFFPKFLSMLALTLLVFVGQTSAQSVSLKHIPSGGGTAGIVSGQGKQIVVEVSQTGITQSVRAIEITFDFDLSLLTLTPASSGWLQPGADTVTLLTINPAPVPANVRFTFTTKVDVTGRNFSIGLKQFKLDDRITIPSSAMVSFNALCPGDFDNNGVVNVADFLLFANAFGKRSSDAGYNALMDMDSSGSINVADFLLFANVFGTTCDQPPRNDGTPKIYWTDWNGGKIQRANLDGTGIEDLVTGLKGSDSIVLDLGAKKMYWSATEAGKIQRANLDGTGVEDLISGLSWPRGIALDLGAKKMYWSAAEAGKIQRANLDGTGIEDLVTGLNDPNHIALDLGAKKMYWTNSLRGKIQRANLDGTGVEDVVSGSYQPLQIALNLSAGKMYWTDGWPGKISHRIYRANLDGTSIEDLVTIPGPDGLALDLGAGKMYWTEPAYTDKIKRANLDGTGVEDIVTVLGRPIGIALNISGDNGSGGGDSTSVTIPDANLRAAIETALGKGRGAPITQAEMASLTRLEAPNKEIRDLTGLEHATGLTELLLGPESLSTFDNSNDISDLSPLSGLTNLTRLYLGSNSISDVSPLSNFTNLRYLRLSNNSISDVSPLSGLSNLKDLTLYGNSISDVSALSNLNNLTDLNLSVNSISDVSALSNLNNLIQLYIFNNSISDVSALSGLTNLKTLNLSNNSISDLSPLVANTGLVGSRVLVYVRGNPLSATSRNTHIPTLQARGVTVFF